MSKKSLMFLSVEKTGQKLKCYEYLILKTYTLTSLGHLESGYTIGKRNRIIKGKLARNQFEYVQYTGIQAEDIPPEQITLREIVSAQSVCGGQGYRRCHCRSNCLSKRCSCLKAGHRCNSACHSHKSCENIDK